MLAGVYHISKLTANIMSLGQLEENGCKIVLEGGFLRIFGSAMMAPGEGTSLSKPALRPQPQHQQAGALLPYIWMCGACQERRRPPDEAGFHPRLQMDDCSSSFVLRS